jgi:hypothetical protein
MASEEFGRYIPGKGFVAGKKKNVPPVPDAEQVPSRTPLTVNEGPGDGIQKILTKVFGTVPRNKLKEAGIE